jgi:hypothetical protein
MVLLLQAVHSTHLCLQIEVLSSALRRCSTANYTHDTVLAKVPLQQIRARSAVATHSCVTAVCARAVSYLPASETGCRSAATFQKIQMLLVGTFLQYDTQLLTLCSTWTLPPTAAPGAAAATLKTDQPVCLHCHPSRRLSMMCKTSSEPGCALVVISSICVSCSCSLQR